MNKVIVLSCLVNANALLAFFCFFAQVQSFFGNDSGNENQIEAK